MESQCPVVQSADRCQRRPPRANRAMPDSADRGEWRFGKVITAQNTERHHSHLHLSLSYYTLYGGLFGKPCSDFVCLFVCLDSCIELPVKLCTKAPFGAFPCPFLPKMIQITSTCP